MPEIEIPDSYIIACIVFSILGFFIYIVTRGKTHTNFTTLMSNAVITGIFSFFLWPAIIIITILYEIHNMCYNIYNICCKKNKRETTDFKSSLIDPL